MASGGGRPGVCLLVHWMGLIRDETKSFVTRLLLGGRYLVIWTDRHVTPADWRTHAFTPRQWGALFPPPLDEDDETWPGEAPAMAMSEPNASDLPAEVAGWLDDLNILVESVQEWSAVSGWRGRLTSKHMAEKGLGRYEVPVLVLDRDDAEVSLVPVARQGPGADGLVDLFRMPAYDAVASLYLEDGQWFIHYAFTPDPGEAGSEIETERLPLEEGSLNRVLDDITKAAHA